MSNEKTKKCCTCKLIRPLSEFNKNKSTPDGLAGNCKDCAREARRRYKQKNRDGYAKSASSDELLNEALDSCLETLCEIEENILNEKGRAEAVKTVIIDLVKANKLDPMKTYKTLEHGSFRYHNRKLTVRLSE